MMKKLLLSLPLYLLIHFALGQTLDLHESATEKHVLVRGTKVFLIPPMGFEASNNYKGFQDPTDPSTMIMIMDIPGPLSAISAGFTAETMKPRGMNLSKKENIRVNGYEGYWVDLEQSANGLIYSKHIVVFGDEQQTTLINGIFLKDSVRKGEEIKKSLASVFVQKDLELDPRKDLTFTVDESVGGLQLFQVVGNAMILNRDGKAPTQSEDEALLIIDKSFQNQEITHQKAFCLKRLSQYPDKYKIPKASELQEIKWDGLSGYALTTQNLDETKEEDMFQAIIFDEEAGGYYLFLGTYKTGHESAQKDIHAVIMTFARKP